jgi:hypothetical protein
LKKRIAAVFLCVCLLLCCAPASRAEASGSVCFIAVNEQLLELSYTPYFSGGVTYLPYWVFTNYGFSIYYSYFSDTSTAMLYTADKQLFFDMAGGSSYDGSGKTYTSTAVMRNGTVYLPANFMCNFFGGMSCTYISGGEYGDVVRLKTSGNTFTDEQFLRAANMLMKSRREAYTGDGGMQTPETSETPPSHEGTVDQLSFIGLPTSTIVSALRRYDVTACFFLTADDVRRSPELVRRLAGDGHSFGVLCQEDTLSEYEETSALIFEASHMRTILVTALGVLSEDCMLDAKSAGLVYWSYSIDGMSSDGVTASYDSLIELIEARDRSSSFFLSCDENTDIFIAQLLNYLSEAQYEVRAPRETDVWSGG